MNDRIQSAFGQIRAEEKLKQDTAAFLKKRTGEFGKQRFGMRPWRMLAAAVCSLFLMAGMGYWAYFTPTSAISVDINPSVELEINRFDRVISVEGWNEDGVSLAEELDILNLQYADALNIILSNQTIQEYLSRDEVLSIAVTGSDVQQSEAILRQAQSCTMGRQNIYCSAGDPEMVEEAHAQGLSFGKYQAFLELQKMNPDVTAEAVSRMTMREIRDMLEALSGGNYGGPLASGGPGQGAGEGFGQGHGFGRGPGGNGGQGDWTQKAPDQPTGE